MKRIAFGHVEFRILNGAPRFYVRLWNRVLMYWPKEPWKRRIEFTSATILLAFTLFLSGCPVQHSPTTQPVTYTPAQTLILGTDTLTATLNGIADARDLGLVTQTEVNSYKPVIDALIAVRNQAEKDLRAGNVTDAQSYLNQYQAGLNQLAPLLAKIAAKKQATTQPH